MKEKIWRVVLFAHGALVAGLAIYMIVEASRASNEFGAFVLVWALGSAAYLLFLNWRNNG